MNGRFGASERPLDAEERRDAIGQARLANRKAQVEIDQQPRRQIRFESRRSTGGPERGRLELQIAKALGAEWTLSQERERREPRRADEPLSEDVYEQAEARVHGDV